MAIQIHDVSHYIDTARRLAEQVAIDADRIDAERQLPTELANQMADEGLFRLLLPRSFGGVEMEHPDFLNILEVFAGGLFRLLLPRGGGCQPRRGVSTRTTSSPPVRRGCRRP